MWELHILPSAEYKDGADVQKEEAAADIRRCGG